MKRNSQLEYLRVLHLAASTHEQDVEAALELLIEAGDRFDYEDVRELVSGPKPKKVPAVTTPKANLAKYGRLLDRGCANG